MKSVITIYKLEIKKKIILQSYCTLLLQIAYVCVTYHTRSLFFEKYARRLGSRVVSVLDSVG